MRKIGILGGSFDPVHAGHLMMAESAAGAFELDKVIFVVANQSPFKKVKATAQDRLSIIKAAIKSNSRLAVSDIELKRGGISYTADTLGHFKKTCPRAELFLIIGDDLTAGLSRWRNIAAVKKCARFIVIERGWFDVSSTLIRRRLRQKKSIRYLTTDAVIKYINRHHLYQESS